MKKNNYIKHIIEPKKLYLSWQNPKTRNRFVVAELFSEDRFLYLTEEKSYKEALKEDFTGYPAFSIKQKQYSGNVIAAFIRRCPPRSRLDLDIYFKAIRIPIEYKDQLSDFALLAYSAAKIPDDPFMIINPFENIKPPFELMIEVAGFRYIKDIEINDFEIGDKVIFEKEPNNPKDENAVKIIAKGIHIGYVMKGLNKSVISWINKGYKINAVIERKNGTKDRPLIHIFTEVRD